MMEPISDVHRALVGDYTSVHSTEVIDTAKRYGYNGKEKPADLARYLTRVVNLIEEDRIAPWQAQ